MIFFVIMVKTKYLNILRNTESKCPFKHFAGTLDSLLRNDSGKLIGTIEMP